MTSLVTSSTRPAGVCDLTSDSTASEGSMQGRQIVPQTVSNPLLKVLVPSIQNQHPDVPLNTLPPSLAKAAGTLNALEITLCEVFFISTETNLHELDRMFRDIDFSPVLLRFSFLSSLIHTVNNIDFMGDSLDDKTVDLTRQEIAALLPDLVKNLIEKWEEKNGQLTKEASRMGQKNRLCALEKIQEVKEVFDYLATVFNNQHTRFDIFGTATVHLSGPKEKNATSVAARLEQMLKVQTAMLRSFSRNHSFWNAAEDGDVSKHYPDRFDLMQKLIRRRLTQQMFSTEAMVQLRESLYPHWSNFGSMHINALGFERDPSRAQFNRKLGFFPYLFQQLAEELSSEHTPRLLALTMSISPSYIKMHKQYSYVMQAMHCSTLVQTIKSRGSTVDLAAVDQIVREARKISAFFSTAEKDVVERGVYTTGVRELSISDMIAHIDNAAGILEELKSPAEDYSESILFSVFDLHGSITCTLKTGLEKYLDLLQKLVEKFDAAQSSKNEIDMVQVEMIVKSIETIVQLTALLNEKYPVINQLTKRISDVQPTKGKKTAVRKRKPKPKRKGKSNRKQPNFSATKPKPKVPVRKEVREVVSNDDEKAEAISDIEKHPAQESFREELEEDLPAVEEVTKELITAVVTFQESVNASAAASTESHEVISHRNVKWKALCAELHHAGFRLLRTAGGHRQYQHPEAKGIGVATVPTGSKNSLSIGVVKNVREQIARAENMIDT